MVFFLFFLILVMVMFIRMMVVSDLSLFWLMLVMRMRNYLMECHQYKYPKQNYGFYLRF